MRYLSVCSGIEAASVAWHPLGWRCVGVAEIDPFASAVLAARFPDIPNYGNLENHHAWPIQQGDIDLLVGGTPCQSFSVAGLRRGLDDPRGNLALVYLGLVARLRPRWVVWENVPGVLSSSGGRDFGSFLGGLAHLGYGWAYRVMDAQYVRVESHPRAVPQRRRRVFVVGCAGGDWQRAARVLLEPEGVRGDLAPRRAPGKGAPGRAAPGVGSGDEAVTPSFPWPVDIADPITAMEAKTYTHEGTTFRVRNVVPDAPVAFDRSQITSKTNRSNPQPDGPSPTLGATTSMHVVEADVCAFSCKDYGGDATTGVAPTLRAMPHDGSHANGGGQVAVAFQSTLGSQNGDVFEEAISFKPGQSEAAGAFFSTTGFAPTLQSANNGSTAVPAVAYAVVSGTVSAKWAKGGGPTGDEHHNLVPDVAGTLGGASQSGGFRTTDLDNSGAFIPTPIDFDSQNVALTGQVSGAIMGEAQKKGGEAGHGVALAFQSRIARNGRGQLEQIAPALNGASSGATSDSRPNVITNMAVRRLTPRECERLQGFPDDWTLVEYRGKPAKDGPRYKAIGNSMAVNVMRWLGERIALVESDAARSPVEAAKKELARGAQLAFAWA